MSEELRPCPFCGGDAKEFTGEDAAPHRWTVECAPVDRDALLALADEMEQKADENRLTGMMSIGRARSWADRIREALGVVA